MSDQPTEPAPGSAPGSAPDPLALDERRIKALDRRKVGISYRGIAQLLGISEFEAWRAVEAALAGRIEQDQGHVAQQRQLEIERLDLVVMVLQQKVRDGDMPAIDRWLKVSDARRRLLGLDAEKDQPQMEPIKYLDLSLENA